MVHDGKRSLADGYWPHVFNLIAVAFLALFAYLALQEKEGQFLSILAALVSLVASKMGDVLKLKVSATGLEAEMRQLIDEAKATVKQLHLLAINQSKVLLESVQSAGRWVGGSSREDKENMRQNIIETLRNLGVGKDEIADVLSVEKPFVRFDYCYAVTNELTARIPPDKMHLWNEFFSPDVRKGIGFEPNPDELEAFLNSIGLLDIGAKERLEDYRHYDETGTDRRADNALRRRR